MTDTTTPTPAVPMVPVQFVNHTREQVARTIAAAEKAGMSRERIQQIMAGKPATPVAPNPAAKEPAAPAPQPPVSPQEDTRTEAQLKFDKLFGPASDPNAYPVSDWRHAATLAADAEIAEAVGVNAAHRPA